MKRKKTKIKRKTSTSKKKVVKTDQPAFQWRKMIPNWRKEFARRKNDGDAASFGDCNFADDMQAIECIEKFERLGGKVEVDQAFFNSIRVLMPRAKNKHLVRERLLKLALTMQPQPTLIFLPTKNRMEIEWS